MGVVAKISSGLIFKDEFDKPSVDFRWEPEPYDLSRIDLVNESGFLQLLGGTSTIYLFLSPLTSIQNFVMDVVNIFNPISTEDTGGIVVYGDESDQIRLEEYYTSPDEIQVYPLIRLVRNHNNYAAYWSNEGEDWNILGTQDFIHAAPKIGLFNSSGQNFAAEDVKVYKSHSVTVGNLMGGYVVKLLDDLGTVIDVKVCRYGETTVGIRLPKVPFNGRFVFASGEAPEADQFSDNTVFEMWGGDSYLLQPNLDLYYYDDTATPAVRTLMKENMEQFLGYISGSGGGTKEIKMEIVNNFTSGLFSNAELSIDDYMDTGQYSRLVRIAPDVSGASGTYGQSLTFAPISGSQIIPFWLKVMQETSMNESTSSDVYFSFNLTSDFTIITTP